VTADYDMKRLADGTDQLAQPGMVSVADLELARLQAGLRQGAPVRAGAHMNRFWLTSGTPAYQAADGIVWLPHRVVQVRTHTTGADAQGNLADTTGNDPQAEEFAGRFTRLYDQVAALRPVYRRLGNLFQLFSLTQAMRFREADRRAGVDLEYFLHTAPVAEAETPRELPGRFAVKKFKREQSVAGGKEILQLWLPSCGGVDMAIEPSAGQFQDSGELATLRDGLLDPAQAVPIDSVRESLRLANLDQEESSITVTVQDHGTQFRTYTGDRVGPLYEGLDARKLMTEVQQLAKSHPGVQTVNLELEGFTPKKAARFEKTSRGELELLQPNLRVRTLRDIAGTPFERVLYSPGIQLVKIDRAQVVAREVWQGAVTLAVRVGDAMVQVAVRIVGRSATVIDDLLAQFGAQFSVVDSLPENVIDLTGRVLAQADALGRSIHQLEIYFEGQYDNQKHHFQFGDANLPREVVPA
jgi:hypothetical protein